MFYTFSNIEFFGIDVFIFYFLDLKTFYFTFPEQNPLFLKLEKYQRIKIEKLTVYVWELSKSCSVKFTTQVPSGAEME